MTDALVGWSGFVGGAMLRARDFDARYRSTDIDEIRGRNFDTLVCCGAPAEKWRANQDPEGDRARLATLTDALAEAGAKRCVLISTVDVYPEPRGVDENTPLDPEGGHAYGRHRLALERFCQSRWETYVVRLPGLYGEGIKKNAVFDLLHDRPLQGVPGNACFQFYDVERVWSDCERLMNAGIGVANVTAEPVSMTRVAHEVFGREMPVPFAENAPSYDVRSVHADLAGGRDGYWFSAEQEIEGLRAFVARERARMS